VVTSSLLKLDIDGLLGRVERLPATRLPREVVEVTLEPSLDTLCVRFKKPVGGELGEPAHPQIHLFKDESNDQIAAVERVDMDELLKEAYRPDARVALIDCILDPKATERRVFNFYGFFGEL